jgi:hypothetical protein
MAHRSSGQRHDAGDARNAQQQMNSDRSSTVGDTGGKLTAPSRPRLRQTGPRCSSGRSSLAQPRPTAAAAEPAHRGVKARLSFPRQGPQAPRGHKRDLRQR